MGVRYSAETRQRFETATASGDLEGPGVYRGAAGDLLRGTWVQFDVRIDGGPARRVIEARFRAFGCPHVIAAADWLCEQAVGGGGMVEGSGMTSAELVPMSSAAALRVRFDAPIDKLGRLLVVEDAWLAALRAGHVQGL